MKDLKTEKKDSVSFDKYTQYKIGGDGFPIQEYTINFLPAIYPDPAKSKKENVEEMKNKN